MQGGRKCLQHCKGSLVGRCQKHDKNVWSQPSWSTKWKGPKYLALIMLVLLLTLIDSKWHVEERQTWLSSDLVDIDRLRMTLGWSEWLCDIGRQWLCPEVKCKEEWHVVILSLLISFLTWNVKRIQDTLLPKWNAKKRVTCGNSLLFYIFSHMKREKNPRHLLPKWNAKRVTCGNSLLFYIFSHVKR